MIKHISEKTIVVLSSHTPSLFWFRIEMMQEFIKRGYHVYAFGNEREDIWAERFLELGVIYQQIDVRRSGMNPLQDMRTLKSIRSRLKVVMPEKIFTFQAKTVIYGTMAANSLGMTEVYPLIAGIGSVFLSDSLKIGIIKRFMVALYKFGSSPVCVGKKRVS